jgi:hypothetical protein
MFTDGFVQTSADAQIEQYFSAWYADFIQEGEKFELTFQEESGQQTLLRMRPELLRKTGRS